MFTPGERYNRRSDLHQLYGGQAQGGISTPKNHPFLMLFTADSGPQYGYQDAWKDGIFYYTGEGQRGDMGFVRGNRAIRDHVVDGKDLHLFKSLGRGTVEYIGQMQYAGYEERRGPDLDSSQRKVIIFRLQPVRR